MEFDRTNVVPIVAALVCIAGMGMVAATLTSAQPIGDDGQQEYLDPPHPLDVIEPDDQLGENERNPNQDVMDFNSQYSTITTCISILNSPIGLIGVLGGFFGLIGLTYRRFNVAIALLTAWTIFPPIMLVYFLLTDCAVGENTLGVGGRGAGAIPAAVGESVVPAANLPVWAIPLLVGIVVIGVSLLLYRSAGVDEEVVVLDEELLDDDPDLDSFARAAKRAADRIEKHNVDADNAVYRAWVEMTSLLNVEDPETYTPGEFAAAATELGMAEDDVDELTTLFNEVRYGGKDAETRADRAIAVLRNIESTYRTVTDSEDGPTGGTGAIDRSEHEEDS